MLLTKADGPCVCAVATILVINTPIDVKVYIGNNIITEDAHQSKSLMLIRYRKPSDLLLATMLRNKTVSHLSQSEPYFVRELRDV